MKKNWLEQLENELLSQSPRTQPKIKKIQPKAGSSEFSLGLFILSLVMLVGLVGAFLYRNKGGTPPIVWNKPVYQPQSRHMSDLEELQINLNKTLDKSRWITDIITLTTIVDNHNLAVTQHNLPKSHYIYINEDWTINRIPDQVRLNDDSRAFLQKFVRK